MTTITISNLTENEFKTLRETAASLEPSPPVKPTPPKTVEVVWSNSKSGKTERMSMPLPDNTPALDLIVIRGKRNTIKENNPHIQQALGKGTFCIMVSAAEDFIVTATSSD